MNSTDALNCRSAVAILSEDSSHNRRAEPTVNCGRNSCVTCLIEPNQCKCGSSFLFSIRDCLFLSASFIDAYRAIHWHDLLIGLYCWKLNREHYRMKSSSWRLYGEYSRTTMSWILSQMTVSWVLSLTMDCMVNTPSDEDSQLGILSANTSAVCHTASRAIGVITVGIRNLVGFRLVWLHPQLVSTQNQFA